MEFIEMIEKDIEIFLNIEEFGEMHEIEGKDLVCIFDESTHAKSSAESKKYEGLHGDFATLYVKESELLRIPRQGENFKVDAKRYSVEKVSKLKGIVEIEMSAYRQGLR